MKTTRFARPFAIAAALGLALSGTASYAKDIRVSYADLNLTTAEGQKVLERRIDRAAKNACGYFDANTSGRIRTPEVEACYKAAHAKARNAMAVVLEDARLGG